MKIKENAVQNNKPQERAEAIGTLRTGMPLNDIATHFTVCKKTIQRMAYRYNL